VVFVILAVFAVAIGRLEAHRLRKDFNAQVLSNAQIAAGGRGRGLSLVGNPPRISPPVSELVGVPGAVARVFGLAGDLMAESSPKVTFGSPLDSPAQRDDSGYRVVTLAVFFGGGDQGYLQYAQPLSAVERQISDLQLILLLGVLIGTALAFGAGSLVARRAIAPIAALTTAASEIERTRDPSSTLPEPVADDEVAELSRTLAGMLASLAEARNETETMLERQRAFVADASHELRTPLTSVLANLELLIE
jgi:two-component system OmpR family sensor kinase